MVSLRSGSALVLHAPPRFGILAIGDLDDRFDSGVIRWLSAAVWGEV